MMKKLNHKKILITGGAGFIGLYLIRRLLEAGASSILVLDNLHQQVHGTNATFPIITGVSWARCDIRNKTDIIRSTAGFDPDVIYHLAAETGTGQSQEEIERYCAVNIMGTVNILDYLKTLPKKERDFILTSTRAVYGEGLYKNSLEENVYPSGRKLSDIQNRDFDYYDANKNALLPLPMDSRTVFPNPQSIYATTKLTQENLLSNMANQLNINKKIVRLQNVYGAGQSLRNPYTGVLSIFTQQLIDGKTINIFEDGMMLRDFIYVSDVAEVLYKLCCADNLGNQIFDIGLGTPTTVLDMAKEILTHLKLSEAFYMISGDHRPGDIRHAFANNEMACHLLKWEPKVSLSEGAKKLVSWAKK